MLSRVEAAGGKVITPRRQVGAMGYIAIVEDTDSNQVGLHVQVAE